MWELWIKFYLGPNEDYSLEDSLSNSSEELSEEARGGPAHVISVKKDVCSQAHILADSCCSSQEGCC